MKVPKPDGSGLSEATVPLINEVDYVSSVSGGSVTAAYWALLGPKEGIKTFEDNFLRRKVRTELFQHLAGKGVIKDYWTKVKGWLKSRKKDRQNDKVDPERRRAIENLPPIIRFLAKDYSRIDFLSGYYQRTELKKTTYQDLLDRATKGDRPYLVINATDIVTRSLFPFVQMQYDLLCSDLSSVKLADAVAASTAYPTVFNSLAIKNLRASTKSSGSDEDPCLTNFFEQQLAPHGPALSHGSELQTNVEELTAKLNMEKNSLVEARKLEKAARDERVQAESASEVASHVYEMVGLEMRRAIEVKQMIEVDLTDALKSKEIARKALRFFTAAERARERAYHHARNALTTVESQKESGVHKAEKKLAILQRELEETEASSKTNVDGWFRQLIGFVDKSWQELVDTLTPGGTVSTGTKVAEEGPNVRASSESSSFEVIPRAGGSSIACIADFAPPSRDGLSPITFTLRKFAQWAENELESEAHSISWDRPEESSTDKAAAVEPETPAPGQEEMEVLAEPGTANARLADLKEVLEAHKERMERFGDGQEMGEKDTENLRTVSNLFDFLSGRIDAAFAETEGTVERLQTTEATPSDVSNQSPSGSPLSEGTHVEASSVGRRLDILGSTLDGVSSHVEALVFAEKHVELENREIDLRRSLNSAVCGIEELQVEIAEKLGPLKIESETRLGEWIKAKDEKHSALLGYSGAAQRVAELEDARSGALKESGERQRKFVEAEARNQQALKEKATRQKQLKARKAALENATETVRKLNNHQGRANALHSDYQFTARRIREQIPHYLDKDLKYVHVLDGGVADNLGVTPLLELLAAFREDFRVDGKYFEKYEESKNRVAVISVDARVASASDFGKELTSPGIFKTIDATVSTAIEGKSSLLSRELERATQGLVKDTIVSGSYLVSVSFDSVREFHRHAKGDKVGHIHGRETRHEESGDNGGSVFYPEGLERCVKAFKNIPTDWDLEDVEKNALVEIAYALVRDSFAYRGFVEQFEGAWPKDDDTVESVCSQFTERLEKVALERAETPG